MLNVNGVYKSIGGVLPLKILNDISFSIKPNEMVAIMGPSGCGKSTLLAILAGLDVPSSGSVSINGTNLYALPARERDDFRGKYIGMVFQNHNLIDELTCYGNIRVPLVFSSKPGSEKKGMFHSRKKRLVGKSAEDNMTNTVDADVDQYFNELLSMLDIRPFIKKFPRQMSGGECQRAAIARALIRRPVLLLADEPTGSLDQANGQRVMEAFRALADTFGCAVALATHDQAIASRCDRVLRMKDGRLL
jgi:ABC-type lipoprotein export system ATPase subunit